MNIIERSRTQHHLPCLLLTGEIVIFSLHCKHSFQVSHLTSSLETNQMLHAHSLVGWFNCFCFVYTRCCCCSCILLLLCGPMETIHGYHLTYISPRLVLFFYKTISGERSGERSHFTLIMLQLGEIITQITSECAPFLSLHTINWLERVFSFSRHTNLQQAMRLIQSKLSPFSCARARE